MCRCDLDAHEAPAVTADDFVKLADAAPASAPGAVNVASKLDNGSEYDAHGNGPPTLTGPCGKNSLGMKWAGPSPPMVSCQLAPKTSSGNCDEVRV